MSNGYDVIVLGVGGMGSAACWALAKRGVRVLGIEQFKIGHALGSSHGASRLIRQAYFEHPDYVPLLKSSYALWDELSADSGRTLFHRQGLVIFGVPQGKILSGVRLAATEHRIPITELASHEARTFHPAFRPPAGHAAIMEPDAGYLEVEACVEALSRCAMARGATVRDGETVVAVEEDADGVTVRTDRGTFRAATVVITAGPWSAKFLPRVASQLSVHRVPLHWFAAPEPQHQVGNGMPCFGFELEDGFYYGLPALDGRGVKVGWHVPGAKVADATKVDRSLDVAELERVRAFVRRCLPGVAAERDLDHATCMYTMTPDENFIVDRRGRVAFAAGTSGHGYKFATVMGEVLADLAVKGETQHPIGFLRERWDLA